MIRRSLGSGIAILLLTAACVPERTSRIPVDADEYVSAIQYRDATSLMKRTAAFRRELAETPSSGWPSVRERHLEATELRLAAYDDAKITGRLPLAPDGIDLIQGLAIGKGIYYRFEEIRVEESAARAVGVMEVTPDYGPHRTRGLPEGTRVYLMGEPFGTIETVLLGEEVQEPTVRVVLHVRLEWRFVWFEAVDVYPEGWAVESVRVLPETVEMIDLQRDL